MKVIENGVDEGVPYMDMVYILSERAKPTVQFMEVVAKKESHCVSHTTTTPARNSVNTSR